MSTGEATNATAPSATSRSGAPTATTSGGRPRDVRLDFFRGIGMFIIFIAHIPANEWGQWIPARFGFSDATEIFVFCSGMASAIAFGKIYAQRSFALGTARTVYRVWQVYWAHISLFLVMAVVLLTLDHIKGEVHYARMMGLVPFLEEPAEGLLHLMALTFQPPLFDILPMYLVILAMMPIVMALVRVSVPLTIAVSLLLWLVANFDYLNLPAEWWSDRGWFFNPFAWQLIFFTGFFLMAGYLPRPPINKPLVIASLVIVVGSIPFNWIYFAYWFPIFFDIWEANIPWRDKSELGILRYVHFLALAYLAYAAAGENGRRLIFDGVAGVIVDVCRKVGQQALPAFMSGIILSVIAGAILDAVGRDALTVSLANIIGCALLVAVAYIAGYFKSQPWRRQARPATPGPVPTEAKRAQAPAGGATQPAE